MCMELSHALQANPLPCGKALFHKADRPCETISPMHFQLKLHSYGQIRHS